MSSLTRTMILFRSGYGRPHLIAALLFGTSIMLRLSLASQGGQYYFPDESRYNRGIYLYQALRSGDVQQVRYISTFPDHMLFSWIAAGISVLHHGFAALSGKGDWANPSNITSTIWFGAAALALFSAFNVALIYKIARRLGGGTSEALWAMLLMTVGQATSYHSRHLVPYESALFFALFAFYVGMSTTSTWRIFTSGLLAGLSYGIYNGYWFLVPVVWLALVASTISDSRRITLATAAGCGAIAGVAAPLVAGWLVAGQLYFDRMLRFSHTVTQGEFREGWSLPWEYLWHAEGIVGAGVAVAIVAAISVARANGGLDFRVRLLALMLLVSYGLLVLFSNGLNVFVVYARTVKPLVPFLCLLGGWALARMLASRRSLQIAVATALLVHGGLQFTSNFYRVFPREVGMAVTATWGNPQRAVSLEGPRLELPRGSVTRPDLVLVNAQSLHPLVADQGYPAGRVILRVPHPLQSPAFQYDAHDPKERALLRTRDVAIKLIALPSISESGAELP